MTKLPEHLHKKIQINADEYTGSTYFHLEYSISGKTAMECNKAFVEGASAMHSMMLEELKTIVKALESIAAVHFDLETIHNSDFENIILTVETDTMLARKALTHYREKIEGIE